MTARSGRGGGGCHPGGAKNGDRRNPGGVCTREESETVVVDGGQDPWGEGRKIDQGGTVSALND